MEKTRFRRVSLWVLAAAGSAAYLSLILAPVISGGRPVYTAEYSDDSQVDEERFLVVLFPIDREVLAYDAGSEYVLGRAVLASLAECRQEKIEVFVGNQPVEVERDKLTAFPDSQNYALYIENLNKELAIWAVETDWKHVDFEIVMGQGMAEVSLKIKGKRGEYYQYGYDCDEGGHITPRRIILRR